MSNLGGYQIMTTLAKKVGGPLSLALILAGGGYVVIRSGEFGIKTLINKSKKMSKDVDKSTTGNIQTFNVTENGIYNEIKFTIGQQYYVLEKVEEAILIELIGAKSNPYIVSEQFLKEISNYI